MFRADDARVENARGAGQRINRRVNAALDDLAAEVSRRVQVRKRRGGSGVRIVIGGNVNRLHGSNRTALRRSDALLQFANFGVEVRLVAHGGRHAAEQRGNFRTCLHETENVVDEKKHVEVLLVAEILGNRESCEAYTKTRAGRLRHLAIDKRRARFFRVPRDNNAALGHFQPKVIPFARALTHAGEHGDAAVLHRNIVNEFHDENGLAHARAAEEANLAALQIGFDQIDHFNSRLEHFERRGLIFQRWRRAMNLVVRIALNRPKLVHGLAKDVHHAAKRGATNRHGNSRAEVIRLHTSDHSFDGFHSDCADASFAKVLLHFRRHVEWLGKVVAFAGNAASIVDRRKMSRLELNVHHRSDDLHNVPNACVFVCHAAFS